MHELLLLSRYLCDHEAKVRYSLREHLPLSTRRPVDAELDRIFDDLKSDVGFALRGF